MDGIEQYDPQLGYMPAIPLPFQGRLKWWHLRTHFVCMECRQGFRSNGDYTRHYALNHIESATDAAASTVKPTP